MIKQFLGATGITRRAKIDYGYLCLRQIDLPRQYLIPVYYKHILLINCHEYIMQTYKILYKIINE
jgi:hypothetical protein